MMEVDNKNSNSKETPALEGCSETEKEAKKPADSNESSNAFINHAEIAWHENRRIWIGDQSRKTRKTPRDEPMSFSMTYDDLLSTNDPFREPIPLAAMVDFLVDTWDDEGFHD